MRVRPKVLTKKKSAHFSVTFHLYDCVHPISTVSSVHPRRGATAVVGTGTPRNAPRDTGWAELVTDGAVRMHYALPPTHDRCMMGRFAHAKAGTRHLLTTTHMHAAMHTDPAALRRTARYQTSRPTLAT